MITNNAVLFCAILYKFRGSPILEGINIGLVMVCRVVGQPATVA